MTEDWIKKAWEQAEGKSEKIKEKADYINGELNDKMASMIDIWFGSHENKEACTAIMAACAENRAISDALFELNRIFFIGGFITHIEYEENLKK